MIQINLLPWRELRQEDQKNRMIIMIALTAIVSLLLLALLHGWIVLQVHAQERSNEILKNESMTIETTRLEIQAYHKQKQALLDKMADLNHLLSQQTAVAFLFQEIEKVVPDNLRLTSIAKMGRRILMDGRTDTPKNLTMLVEQIHLSQSLTDPVLSLMEMKEESINYKEIGFQLSCSVK